MLVDEIVFNFFKKKLKNKQRFMNTQSLMCVTNLVTHF